MSQFRPLPWVVPFLVWPLLVVAGTAVALPTRLHAQGLDLVPYVRLGSELDRARLLATLLGRGDAATFARGAASQLDALNAERDTVVVLHPEISWSYNSAHSWGANDGALRAGRGQNLLVSAGVALRVGRVTAVFAPQLVAEANEDFQTIPYQQSGDGRSRWSNPFYGLDHSIDFPQRFGREARGVGEAEGRIAVDLGAVWRLGVGREQRWWGPGVSNALILSSNASPIEQVFVETRRPLVTAVGQFELQYLLGRLRESEYFDYGSANNRRTLSAAILSWQPKAEWTLIPSMGVARAVMARGDADLSDALLVLADAGRPWVRPADTTKQKEQMFGVFARWHVPESGAEAYVEWVRYEQPASLRDLLQQPGHSQGYTLGVQWARPWRRGLMHLGSEFSYLEPSPSIRTRPVSTSYIGTSVKQGWTQGGQMIGPWIGPGGSSQLFTGAIWYPKWRGGISVGRLRRDPNVRFREPAMPRREDVQLYASVKYGRTWRGVDITLEYTEGARLNHLYQAIITPDATGGETTGIDLLNRTLSFSLTPRLPRPAW